MSPGVRCRWNPDPVGGIADVSNSRAKEEPSWEEPGNTIPPEGTDEQDQDDPNMNRKKTLLEYCEDAMDEHETLGCYRRCKNERNRRS